LQESFWTGGKPSTPDLPKNLLKIFNRLIRGVYTNFCCSYVDNISLMKTTITVVALFVALAVAQQCDMSLDLRVDCGYMGIDQSKCEAKQCCWKPARLLFPQNEQPNDTPWCFFPSGSNPCGNISFSWSGGMGFDQSFYDKMYKLFDANIDIQGKGGVVAAPDHSTPGGDYYYHWMRDAALTMRTFMEINDFDLSKVENKMKSYVNWVKKVQGETDPQGYDVRINPKFELPNGEVYVGGWCRPQTDGPGLRSATLVMFAQLLLEKGQTDYVKNTLVDVIKKDLDWVLSNWQSDGCDLWEEVRSNDFYWGRAAYVFSLTRAAQLFNKLGDSSYASRCSSTKSTIAATLDAHWTGSFVTESSNRQKDGAVVHAFSSFDVISFTDQKVAKTMQVLATTFCSEYAINQEGIKGGIPGILIGRYPGDSYAGGNPWQLLTAVYAKTFYQGATALIQSNGFESQEDRSAWFSLLKLDERASLKEQVEAAVNAGDAVMYRLFQYVKNDGGHIAEQIDRNGGKQKSANDLTWSFANILSAMKTRQKAVESLASLAEIRVA
jgi:glucoamylase